MMQHALFVPPYDELSDIAALADIAAAAEQSGFDGVFLWDHLARPEASRLVADTTVALTAIALGTQRVRFGPMVTPLVRRRPHKAAREFASLDRCSGGRLTIGLGLGVDTGRELSGFGEMVGLADRGDYYDEALQVMQALWSEAPVWFSGRHLTVNGMEFHPAPIQRPRPPIWAACRTLSQRALQRASRLDGLVPVEVDPDKLLAMLEVVNNARGSLDQFEVAVVDRGDWAESDLERCKVTWRLWWVDPGATRADIYRRIETFEGA